MWRRAHPLLSQGWYDIEDFARGAIDSPGETLVLGKIKFRREGNWFRIQMPSGRSLCYPHPRLDNKGKISFMGVDQYTRKWGRINTFGGKMFENIVQAGARDVMAHGMISAEQAGFELILTVHDEIICEYEDREIEDHAILSDILSTVPVWAPGLPLAAAGYDSYRYRKE